MTTATAVAERTKQLIAAEKRSKREANLAAQQKLREQAEREVAAETRKADEAARLKRADEVEAKLRARHTPFVTVTMDDGREVVIELGASEPVARGTQTEAVRRLCVALAQSFASRVLLSRNTGEVAPSETPRVLAVSLQDSGGLYPAAKMGLVTVREARP